MPALNEKTTWIGLAIVFGVGILSWWLAQFAPRLGSVTIAILVGVVVGNVFFNNPTGQAGAKIGEKQILPISIVLLGVELQLLTLVALGPFAAIIIAVSIATSILLSVKLGEMLGFSRSFSFLIGAGNGICGSSAVAATSISIDADEADTGISISVVNLLGTIGIFAIPALIQFLMLTDLQAGLLTGGTLQAFGQVVAAGFSVNDDVGNIATVVKMGRVLMLGPMVILIGSWVRSHPLAGEKQKTDGNGVRIPRFILGFFLMSLLASSGLLPIEILEQIKTVGKFLLVVAMAGIGMRIQFETLFKSGVGALLFGALVSLAQITITLVVILLLV